MNPARHIIAALDGTQVTKEIKQLVLKEHVLGFTLFKWNMESCEQVLELNRELQALARQAGHPLILAVDHEGGSVFRLPPPFQALPDMRRWGDLFQKTGRVEPLFELGRVLAEQVSSLGFNLNFAPVVDVHGQEQNPVIGKRAFSDNPEIVYKLARQVIRGHLHEHIIPCLKHFPGHGATRQDSHHELPVDERSENNILTNDMFPFQKLMAENLSPCVMTAHVRYEKIDPDQPATLSKKILEGILRRSLHFDEVIVSDDLLMKAIADHHDISSAAGRFFACSGDVVLICKQPETALEVIQRLKIDKSLETHFKQSQKRIRNILNALSKNIPKQINIPKMLEKHYHWVREYFPDK